MKKTIILASLLVSSLSFYSCQDDALETKPSEMVSNPKTEAKVNGLYNLMIDTRSGGTNLDHDDFGQKSYDIYSDLVVSDVVMDGVVYGWYSALANYNGLVDNTNGVNLKPWTYYYKMVYAANDVIDDFEEGQQLSATERHFVGQAKGMRAYAYFYLMQFFTKDYDPNADAIPIYTNTKMNAQPIAKQSAVYKLIVEDLKAAQTDLADFQRGVAKARMNKDVATGLLAYAYAAMGENALAATEAGKIVNSGMPITSKSDVAFNPSTDPNTIQGSYAGFNNSETPSWMWGYDITTEQGLDLVSWWGQMDIFTYSYASVGDTKSIDENLRLAIHNDDVRKNQFVNIPDWNDTYLPIGKFYAPKREEQGQRIVTTDYVYMRTDEFHLLYAETLAKSGQEGTAKTVLKNFLKNRMDDVNYIDGLSGQALLDEIYLQTRIEMWGEGKTYLAMKRNKKDVKRGSTHMFYADTTIPFGDNRLYFKIPQDEIINNPNL